MYQGEKRNTWGRD